MKYLPQWLLVKILPELETLVEFTLYFLTFYVQKSTTGQNLLGLKLKVILEFVYIRSTRLNTSWESSPNWALTKLRLSSTEPRPERRDARATQSQCWKLNQIWKLKRFWVLTGNFHVQENVRNWKILSWIGLEILPKYLLSRASSVIHSKALQNVTTALALAKFLNTLMFLQVSKCFIYKQSKKSYPNCDSGSTEDFKICA